jgi:hypothetical protein
MQVREREALEANEGGGGGVGSGGPLAAPEAGGSQFLAGALGCSRQPVDPREDAFDVALRNVALETVGGATQGEGLVEGDEPVLTEARRTHSCHISLVNAEVPTTRR